MDFYRVLRGLDTGGSAAVGLDGNGDLAYGRHSLIVCDSRDADRILAKARASLSQLPGQLGLYVQHLSETEAAEVQRLEAEEGKQ